MRRGSRSTVPDEFANDLCIKGGAAERGEGKALGIAALGEPILSGRTPRGAFYAFLAIGPRLAALAADHIKSTGVREPSVSWAVTRYLIERARIGCIPGVDFGPSADGYIRFCFARDRNELTGALEAMTRLVEGPA